MRLVHGRFEPNPWRLLLEDSVPDTTRLLHPSTTRGARRS
jgi:hypothetical protein